MSTPPPKIETIRNGLIGSLNDFVQDAGFHSHVNLVADLVYSLAEYREEDIPFYPSVYLVSNAGDSETLNVLAPGAERVVLGSADSIDCCKRILKDSAALADGGWSIFVVVSDAQPKYGLFRSELLPFSRSSSDHMADPSTDSGKALLVRNCSKNCVELLASDGKRMEFGLTAARPTAESTSEAFWKLANSATELISKELQEASIGYFVRLIALICQRSHGTIIVVLEHMSVPEEFQDGVILDEPIDLLKSFEELQVDEKAHSLSSLIAKESLLRGIVQSDGITVLNKLGQVVAFRVFVKPNESEIGALANEVIEGGARSRAFQLLTLRLGAQLACAFFRSQDGQTKCVVKQ